MKDMEPQLGKSGEDMDPQLLEWEEDVCHVCGAHVGYGVRLFHLGRCDEHSPEEYRE